MYRDMKKNVANMPSETLNATVLPAENDGILKNASGIIAFGLRLSNIRNAASSTPAATSEATISGSVQPRWLASMSPYVAKNRAGVTPGAARGRRARA